MALAVFADGSSAADATARIEGLRDQLGRAILPEFHYHRDSQRTREALIDIIVTCEFTYHAVIVDKQLFLSHRQFGSDLYIAACSQALLLAEPDCVSLSAVVDEGSKDRSFKRAISADLRRTANHLAGRPFVRRVRMRDSRTSSLVQLADYLAGIVSRAEQEDERAVAAERRLRRQAGRSFREL